MRDQVIEERPDPSPQDGNLHSFGGIAVSDLQETLSEIEQLVPRRTAHKDPDISKLGLTQCTIELAVRRRHENGLDATGAVVQVNKAHYLHKGKFLRWLLTRSA